MKTVFTYLLIIFGLGVLYISTSEKIMKHLYQLRNENGKWWGTHDALRKGDLVSMAYLDYATIFHSDRGYAFHRPTYNGADNINLYLYGDSYTHKIPDSAFACVNRYEYAWVYNNSIIYNLDTTKKNILIFAHAERYIRYYFSGISFLDYVKGNTPACENATPAVHKNIPGGFRGKILNVYQDMETLFHRSLRYFFHPYINQNLEFNLFDYHFLSMPKMLKAWLNYRIFNRASGDVVIAGNGRQLYIKETVTLDGQMSAFSPIRKGEFDTLVNNLNTIYNHYKKEGFDEVYLAMIPNPVSILEPGKYNQLIPRLQNDKRLQMQCIDIYTVYQNADTVIYRPGDTHWYNSGMQLWIEEVNKLLRIHSAAHQNTASR